jgi:hypothetical protein
LNGYGALQQIEIAKYLGLVLQPMKIDKSSIIFNLLEIFFKNVHHGSFVDSTKRMLVQVYVIGI